ncbi:Crp/Fnr family transcriptional regulator [Siminovitchia sp. 179-K 8D1 HS]|uniref:Crp/Fnr family transcriptional regulator n=1 Tax=Siminovitchia sp. 179-K 8D1 HS TaxID=3142385 RepID=UPI0039A1DC8C
MNVSNAATDNQVAHSLLYLMETYQSSEINLTQQELSHFVGLTRITVYKILKKWTSKGLITIQNRKIFVLNRSALKKIAFS